MKKIIIYLFPALLSGCQQPQKTQAQIISNPVYIFYESHIFEKEAVGQKMFFVDQNKDYSNWLVVEEGYAEPDSQISFSPSGNTVHIFYEPNRPSLVGIDTIFEKKCKVKILNWCDGKLNSIEDHTRTPYLEPVKELKKRFYLDCPLSKYELEKFREIERQITIKRENWVIQKCSTLNSYPTVIGFGMAHQRIEWILKNELHREVQTFFTPQEEFPAGLAAAVMIYLIFEDKEYFSF